MASSHQGIPTLPSSLHVAEISRHPQSSTYRLPRIQGTAEEAKHVQPRTPVTPDQRWRRPNRILDSHNTDIVADRSITLLRPSDAPTLPPASPSSIANTRIRRSQHGLTLLQSPARAGHTARMRQIFEDAGHECRTTRHDQGGLYPQLPNISRKASPPLFHNGSVQRAAPCVSPDRPPAFSCPLTGVPLVVPQPQQSQANLSSMSERTSGSWSDDSGYFVANSRGQALTPSISPEDRIYDWLLRVSRVGSNATEDAIVDHSDEDRGSHHATQASIDVQEFTTKPEKIDTERPAQHPGQHLQGYQLFVYNQTKSLDPFIGDDNDSGTCLPLGSRRNQEPLCLRSSRNVPQAQVTDFYKRRDFNWSRASPLDSDVDRPALSTLSHIPPLHDNQNNRSTPSALRTLQDDDLELSPLSPDVCIERGPSRYHANRKLLNRGHTSTPSKERSYIDDQSAAQLKENVNLRDDKLPDCGSPLATRSARAGTKFQRSQYNTLTFNINKHN
ncbi:uncharacterized protein K460DRAFT_419563 [Cucurbitaria berberidis CBS 394.84]|uniref:Uncharacterized protein n=1 Tax=Cucurbitaria berberidis CBS 394.84 TaxID=1168544 RepID=A0A9P4L514_9PLEO|nr:uncharacterized protein K460DRAFT_419563 [Cucurbitaria berberidis CBS 394.84]KAF1841508.1 hypothetical protein K460DRAFT_419563 [Cucurbitaria berberidis CBS 394.84]